MSADDLSNQLQPSESPSLNTDQNVGIEASMGRRRFLTVAVGTGVVVVGGFVVALIARPDHPADEVADTTVPGPSIQVTKSTPPPLPIPEAVPENPHADTAQNVIGTLEIARINISADIQEGITLTAINRGPGHWPGTAMPGELGNVVIAGHRTTYSKPFNRLNELEPGDLVTMTTPDGIFTYRVRGIVIVPGDAIDIAQQSYAHTATLFACHPPGSARERIVAKLQLLKPDGTPVDPDDVLPPIDAGAQETGHTLVVKSTDPLGQSGG